MNKREIIARAFRRLNVIAYDEAPDGPMHQTGLETLAQVLADLNSPWGGCFLPFAIDDEIPTEYRSPLTDFLAFRLAPDFQRTPPMPEITCLMRIRAVNKPYVRCSTEYCDDYGVPLPCDSEGVIFDGDPITGIITDE